MKNADFETLIYPNVYWVPYNILGKTQYSDLDMYLMSREEAESKIHNIYELAQFIQAKNFVHLLDISFEINDKERWEVHKSGIEVLKNKAGCCSSYSGLVVQILQNQFDNIFNLCIVSDSGWGHAMNFIVKDGYYYFFDISSQLNEYNCYVPIETGIKRDFVRAKFITGGCYKTDSICSFIKFFLRYHMLKMTDFIFFTLSAIVIPPILIEKKERCYVSFSAKDICDIYEYNKKGKIKYVNKGMER